MAFDLIQLLAGFVLAVIISLLAWRAHSLSRSGALAATLLGTVVFGLGGLAWAVLLMGFFISSSALSRFLSRRKSTLNEKFSKGSQRDAGQVLANGGFSGIFVLLHVLWPEAAWPWLGFAGTLAAVNADTWATELGVLSRSRPRLLTSGKPVEPGTSGAVSLPGSLAALGGALLIALLAATLWPGSGLQAAPLQFITRLALVSLAGLAGSLVDSWLGATVQAIYTCPACQKETERHPTHACGSPTTLKRGWRWLDNDAVNAACALSGALLALAAGALLPGRLGLAGGRALDLAGGAMMATFSFSSPDFENGGDIPVQFTCDGDDLSPALRWSGLPDGTRSLALVAEDPDAPVGLFIHWVIYNIPPALSELPQGVAKTPQIDGLGSQGPNGFRRQGYGGPCPPPGAAHRYYFRLYALDLEPDLTAGLSAAQLKTAIQDHLLAQAEWMGRYKRR